MDKLITRGSNIDGFRGEKDNIIEEAKQVMENTPSFPF